MKIEFWRTSGGKSPVEKYIENRGAVECFEAIEELKTIDAKNFQKCLSNKKMLKYPPKSIKGNNKETIYQINIKRHRIVFGVRGSACWFLDAFLKKSKEEEQKIYQKARKKLNYL